MATHNLLLLPGDGIGPEVMAEVERVRRLLQQEGQGRVRDRARRLCGGCSIDKHGMPLTDAALAKAKAADAIIFGSVGGPKWDKVAYDIRPEAGLLRLRKDLDLFANLRPAICYPALAEASSLKRELVEGLDILILRELTGGTYFGEPKEIVTLENGQKRAVDTTVYTTHEIERIARVAFDLARKRRNKVHSAEKRNVMKHRRAVEPGRHGGARSGVQGRRAAAHPGRRLRHAARAQPQAVRRHRLRQPVRRHAVGRGRDADRLARHAAVGLARRARCQDRQAQGALRADPRLGARHRRQGHRQPDRADRPASAWRCATPATWSRKPT